MMQRRKGRSVRHPAAPMGFADTVALAARTMTSEGITRCSPQRADICAVDRLAAGDGLPQGAFHANPEAALRRCRP